MEVDLMFFDALLTEITVVANRNGFEVANRAFSHVEPPQHHLSIILDLKWPSN